MIKLENVTKTYKTGVRAVNNMSVDIGPGEFVYVIGPTGAGKSTFIKLLYREEKATSGKVIVAGKDVSKIRNNKVPYFRRNLGIVFQNYRLLPKKTVFENIAFALEVTDTPRNEIRKKVRNTMELVGLSDKANAFPDQLSGGQQQRVALARTLNQNPSIILADEPVAALDPITAKAVMSDFRRINKEMNISILLNIHHVDLALDYADRVIGIRAGEVVYDGPTKDVTQEVLDLVYNGKPIPTTADEK